MRFIFAALSLLLLAIGLFVMALTAGTERTAALLCLLTSAVLATGAGVMGAIERLRAALERAGAAAAAPDPHRYPPTT